MTTDNAIEWLEENEFYRWRLFNSSNGKVQDYDPATTENAQEAIDKLKKAFRLMAPGKYTLKGWQGKNRNAAQSEFMFAKEKESTSKTMNLDTNRETYEKGYQDAINYLRLEHRVEKLEDLVNNFRDELKEVHAKLTDNDPENDGDALSKLGKMASMAPDLASAFNAFKSL